MKHRAAADRKFLGLTSGQVVIILFALLMLAVVIVSVYIGKHV